MRKSNAFILIDRKVELEYSGVGKSDLAPDRIIGLQKGYISRKFRQFCASGGVGFPTLIAEIRTSANTPCMYVIRNTF